MEEPRTVKTMQELREDFVKWRFAEEQVFANRDIESQIAGEDLLHWTEEALLKLMNTTAFAEYLFANGQKKVFVEYMPELEREQLIGSYLVKNPELKEMLLSLHDSCMFFPGDPIYLALGDKIYSPSIFYGREFHFRPQQNECLLKSILNYSLQKDIHIIEKLLEPLRECVALERKKAETDFDSAVGVSANGKEIVCADRVFVHFGSEQGNGDFTSSTVLSFPPESFKKDKIILSNKRQTITNESATRGVFGMLADHDQVLEKRGSIKWLHARHDRCPKILPAGGEYVDFP